MRAVCSGTGGIGGCGWSDMAKPPAITASTPLSTLRLTHSPTVSDPFWDKFCVCETVCAMSNDTPLTTMPNTGNGTVLPRPVLQAQHRPREYLTFWVGRIAT